jgi:hypothetical protein
MKKSPAGRYIPDDAPPMELRLVGFSTINKKHKSRLKFRRDLPIMNVSVSCLARRFRSTRNEKRDIKALAWKRQRVQFQRSGIG